MLCDNLFMALGPTYRICTITIIKYYPMLIGEVTQNLAIKTILSIVPTYSIGR